MIYSIDEIKRKSKNVFMNNKAVKEAYLFGSYAKSCASNESDIDIIAILDHKLDKHFFSLYPELESVFNKKIDIYCDSEVDPRFLNSIRKDFIKIYER